MFKLTNRAAAALAASREKNNLEETVAIRISASESSNGTSAGYQLRFASHPAPDDVVMESEGTKVFLAADLAEPLGTAVLDAVDTGEGERLVLKRRSSE